MLVWANFFVPNLRYHFKHKEIVQSDKSRVTLTEYLNIIQYSYRRGAVVVHDEIFNNLELEHLNKGY